MAQQLPENMRVLRLFAAQDDVVNNLVAQVNAKKNGVTAKSMRRGNETLVAIETEKLSSAAIRTVLSGWERQFSLHCPDAFYGVGNCTLTQSTVAAMAEKQLLFACAEEKTGTLLAEKLEQIEGIHDVFDFGTQSYAHARYASKIAKGSAFAKKYRDDAVQVLAGKMKACYRYSGADYILARHVKEDGTQVLLVGNKTHFLLRQITPNENAVLWLADMLRRAALGREQVAGTVLVVYGAPIPAVTLAEDGAQVFASETDEVLPPVPSKHSASRIFLAVLFVAIVAIATAVGFYFYTGGDMASLWNHAGMPTPQSSISSAELL